MATDVGNLVNVEDVEIVQTGIEYPLSTGPATFTTDDLADAVASQSDPAIKAPRLRLGHSGLNDPEWDGEPAIGTLGNLRLEQSGHTIVGDYVGIPEWLAEVLPSAYPARSIDGAIGVETNTGHNWRLVITDLALLGVQWPGVSTLDDIKALYSKDGPANVTVYTTLEELAASMTKIEARADVDDVRRQYYQSLDSSQYWWWVRSQYYNPDELIVEDEESGDLYRVPFSTNSDGEASFSDPIAVRIEYEDKPEKDQPKKEEAEAAMAAAAALLKRPPEKVFASRAESREGVVVAGTATVDPAALRQALGLETDASDEDVLQAMQDAGMITMPGDETGSTGLVAPGAEQTGTNDAGAGVPGNDPADVTGPSNNDKGDPAVAAPTGTVTVDAAMLEDLKRQAARGDAARKVQEDNDRDSTILAAIKAGKIPKSRQAHWQTQWDKDVEGTKHLLTAAADKGGLAPGLIPVTEEGTAPSDEALTDDAYPSDWLPEVAARRAAAEARQNGVAHTGGIINHG